MLRYFVNKKKDEVRVLMEAGIRQVKPGCPDKTRELFLVVKIAEDYCSVKLWKGSLLTTTDSWNMQEVKPSYSQRAYWAAKVVCELRSFSGLVEGTMFHMLAESLTRELDLAHDEMVQKIGVEGLEAFKMRYINMADSDSSITRGPVEMSDGKKGNVDA